MRTGAVQRTAMTMAGLVVVAAAVVVWRRASESGAEELLLTPALTEPPRDLGEDPLLDQETRTATVPRVVPERVPSITAAPETPPPAGAPAPLPDVVALAAALQSNAEVEEGDTLTTEEYRAVAILAVEALQRHYRLVALAEEAVAEGRTPGTLGLVQNSAILRHVARDLPALIRSGRVLARIIRQAEGQSALGVSYAVDMSRADLCPSLWGTVGATPRALGLTIPHSVVPVEMWEAIYARKGRSDRPQRPSAVPGAGVFRGRGSGN